MLKDRLIGSPKVFYFHVHFRNKNPINNYERRMKNNVDVQD